MIFQADSQKISVKGKYLYGADGAGSKVRDVLLKKNSGLETKEECDIRYKEIFLPPNEEGKWRMQGDSYHTWPRGKHMLTAMPNSNGSLSFALFLPAYGENSFLELNNEGLLAKFLKFHYPDAYELIPNMVEQILNNPLGFVGTLHLTNWHYGNKCLLMGDAAHVMTPFYWQGLNAGFSDCLLLDRMIDKCGGFKEGLFRKFCEQEILNCEVVAKMSVQRFSEVAERYTNPKIREF